MDDSLNKLQHEALEMVNREKAKVIAKVDTQIQASSAFLAQEGADESPIDDRHH